MERSEKDWLTTLLLSIILSLFQQLHSFSGSIAKEPPPAHRAEGDLCIYHLSAVAATGIASAFVIPTDSAGE